MQKLHQNRARTSVLYKNLYESMQSSSHSRSKKSTGAMSWQSSPVASSSQVMDTCATHGGASEGAAEGGAVMICAVGASVSIFTGQGNVCGMAGQLQSQVEHAKPKGWLTPPCSLPLQPSKQHKGTPLGATLAVQIEGCTGRGL